MFTFEFSHCSKNDLLRLMQEMSPPNLDKRKLKSLPKRDFIDRIQKISTKQDIFFTALRMGLELMDIKVEEYDLTGTSLGNANLHMSTFSSVNLSRANLSGADLSCANLNGSNLSRANLRGTNLIKANLRDVTFEQAVYDEHTKWPEDFDYQNSGAVGPNANLMNVTLKKIPLEGLNLSNANLRGTDLSDTNLNNANLSGADLSSANLRGSDLSNVDLSNANLRGTDLSDTNLSNANLSGTDLSSANLSGATLLNTELNNAVLSGINIENILYDSRTNWPEEFIAYDKKGIRFPQHLLKDYRSIERHNKKDSGTQSIQIGSFSIPTSARIMLVREGAPTDWRNWNKNKLREAYQNIAHQEFSSTLDLWKQARGILPAHDDISSFIYEKTSIIDSKDTFFKTTIQATWLSIGHLFRLGYPGVLEAADKVRIQWTDKEFIEIYDPAVPVEFWEHQNRQEWETFLQQMQSKRQEFLQNIHQRSIQHIVDRLNSLIPFLNNEWDIQELFKLTVIEGSRPLGYDHEFPLFEDWISDSLRDIQENNTIPNRQSSSNIHHYPGIPVFSLRNS